MKSGVSLTPRFSGVLGRDVAGLAASTVSTSSIDLNICEKPLKRFYIAHERVITPLKRGVNESAATTRKWSSL
jgi:hypothetical protein